MTSRRSVHWIFVSLSEEKRMYTQRANVQQLHHPGATDVSVGTNVRLILFDLVQGCMDGRGGNAQLFHPCGMDVDSRGNVFIADWGNHCIR